MTKKLTEEQVHEICRMIENGLSNIEIGEKYNINPDSVSSIRIGKTYKNITKTYNLERRWSEKLTEEQVHEICRLLEDGVSNIEIAKRYNIGCAAVSNIRCGRSYKDISKNYNLERLNVSKLTDKQVHEICKLIENGLSNIEIGEKYNINPDSVSSIRIGNTYKHISKKYNLDTLRLTNEQIHDICKLLEEGLSNTEIAKKYDISHSGVSKIRCGISHEHISKLYNFERLVDKNLTDKQIHEICKLLEEGVSNIEIAKKYDIGPGTVSAIRCGKSYTNISKNYNIPTNDGYELTDIEVVHKICKLMEDGYRNIDIITEYKVNRSIVSNIRNGYTHTEISKKYNIQRIFRKRKLEDEVIHEVCRLLEEGYKYKDITKITNISRSTIHHIRNTEKFKDISSQYNFNKNKKNTSK